ncbi:MAG: hypothetical protein NT010_06345 [Proteobacteria bacterium]|nr:hypothetical protein [Pseudomonadota bacterium]
MVSWWTINATRKKRPSLRGDRHTHTLAAPYTMSMIGCVSFQTNLSTNMGMGVPSPEMTKQIGGRLYGCDACQDICPFNQGRWTGSE